MTTILLGCNIRKIFASDNFGDWRGSDPKRKADGNEENGQRLTTVNSQGNTQLAA